MGLPEERMPQEDFGLGEVPTEKEPVPPPDWPPEDDASFQPPPHYAVLERLGNGGMGRLYKARDTRLQRTVALKVLPPKLTHDPVAKERFLREARAASALDHQNICTIYDVGETGDRLLYLSMPCYQGETLRSRLARGPLSIGEALDVTRQVARGLAQAHRQGIVHRDIKPENLMITTEEVVKILDFGIAKLAGSADLTGTEHRIGTPAYMAPEQSRSAQVDHRADLWSLGVVLYEMVSGQRPFRGTNPVMVLQAIQYGVPEPLSQTRPGVPPKLDKIVARLLMKNPKARYPDAESLLADLDGEATAEGRRFRRIWIAAGIAAAVGVGLIAAKLVGPGDRSPGGVGPVQPTAIRKLTNQSGGAWYPSLSPDGKRFTYARWDGSDYDIYLQDIGGEPPVNLTEDSAGDDTHPAFSPNGSQIAFRSERPGGGGIFLMDDAGGSTRRLTDFGYHPAWSPDSRELLVSTVAITDPGTWDRSSRIWRIDVHTGGRQRLLDRDGVQPSWSPNGKRIAYWSVLAKIGRRVLWTVPADGGKPLPVSTEPFVDWNPVWSSDGYLYFVSDRNGTMSPWRIAIDEDTGLPRGEAELVLPSSLWSGYLSLSSSGQRLIYSTSGTISTVERFELDPGSLTPGPAHRVTGVSTGLLQARVSPRGDTIVLTDVDDGQEDLFLARTEGPGTPVHLTRDEHRDRAPSWMPDGSIVFSSNRGGRYGLWTTGPDGSAPRLLGVSQREPLFNPIPSPDGRWLACSVGLAGAALIRGSQPPEPLPLVDRSPFFASSWSPDSRSLAGTVNGNGIFLYSLATRRYQRLTESGWRPVWTADGRKILFLDQGWKVIALDLATLERQEILAPPPGSSFVDMDLDRARGLLYLVRQQSEGNIVMLDLE